jgi:glycerate kinase
MGVATAAARLGVPTAAVAGRNGLSVAEAEAAGFFAVLALADREPDLAVCMSDAGRLLEELGPQLYDAVARTTGLPLTHTRAGTTTTTTTTTRTRQ